MRPLRGAVTAEEALAAGRAIAAQLDSATIGMETRGAVAACYLSIAGEVDSTPLIEWCRGKGMKVAVPVSDGESGYVWAELESDGAIAKGPMGIPEPVGTRIVSANELALALVPGVAFDKRGYRLGHGHGHIDRLYASASQCRKIGVAFAWQVFDEIPFEQHDAKMAAVLTP